MTPKANLTYQHLEESFPLRGQYIFRFKVMHDNNVVWLDLQDQTSKLPTFKDRIYVKATRITWEQSDQVKTPARQEAIQPVKAPVAAAKQQQK